MIRKRTAKYGAIFSLVFAGLLIFGQVASTAVSAMAESPASKKHQVWRITMNGGSSGKTILHGLEL